MGSRCYYRRATGGGEVRSGDEKYARVRHAEVARLLDTRSATLVADIGGAAGLLHAVLERNPALNGIVFDLPILRIARSSAAEAGLGGRDRNRRRFP